jgi:hypothetical protein
MTWRDKTVIRILMLVATLIAREEWKKEVSGLAAHLTFIPEERVEPAATKTQN